MKKMKAADNPDGPVLFIRAEENRVLLTISPAVVRRLTREAIALNRTLGDPTLAAPARPRARR